MFWLMVLCFFTSSIVSNIYQTPAVFVQSTSLCQELKRDPTAKSNSRPPAENSPNSLMPSELSHHIILWCPFITRSLMNSKVLGAAPIAHSSFGILLLPKSYFCINCISRSICEKSTPCKLSTSVRNLMQPLPRTMCTLKPSSGRGAFWEGLLGGD